MSFADSSTIGAEKYAPPTEGRSPISRGIETTTAFFLLNSSRAAVIISDSTSFSLSINSKVLIKVRASASLIVTLSINAAFIADAIDEGDMRYKIARAPEAISRT